MKVHLHNIKYRCVIPKCMEMMEGDSPLCTHHLDCHEKYGHPYGKEVNERVDYSINKGSDKLDAFTRVFNIMKRKGEEKRLTYKRIKHYEIARAQMKREKRISN